MRTNQFKNFAYALYLKSLHHRDTWIYVQYVLFFSPVLSANLVFIFSSGLAVGL